MRVYTTGQVAKLCNVAPRTVSKWIDSGRLVGYKIPLSQDRRVTHDNLVKFMSDHGLPLNGLGDIGKMSDRDIQVWNAAIDAVIESPDPSSLRIAT